MKFSFDQVLALMLSESGMTQAELAKRSGVTEVSISRYIKGTRTPQVDIAEKLANACGYVVQIQREG